MSHQLLVALVVIRLRLLPASRHPQSAAGRYPAGQHPGDHGRVALAFADAAGTAQEPEQPDRLNVWRLEGALFLALMFTGQVPAIWAIPAGVGDVLIGGSAFRVAARLDAPGGRRRAVIFNLLGLLDLVVAIGLGITTNPGPVQIFHTTPSAELLTRFPMALVPGFLVPLAL
jgi:hypothetical protein